jgi:hypothetical protein
VSVADSGRSYQGLDRIGVKASGCKQDAQPLVVERLNVSPQSLAFIRRPLPDVDRECLIVIGPTVANHGQAT